MSIFISAFLSLSKYSTGTSESGDSEQHGLSPQTAPQCPSGRRSFPKVSPDALSLQSWSSAYRPESSFHLTEKTFHYILILCSLN